MYSDDDRYNILHNAEGSGLVWNKNEQDNKNSCAKQLEQLMKKELNLMLHASTLTQYLKVQHIPRQLRSSLMPILLKEDIKYQNKWFNLSNCYSLDLMYLTVEHLQQAIKNLKIENSKVDTELKESSTINDITKSTNI